MINTLISGSRTETRADVLVIGAGTAGLVLATELASRGKRVVCLESGGREQVDDIHPLNIVEQTGTDYAGAKYGRFRCLGGSSTRWGGALIPFQPADLEDDGVGGARWPLDWVSIASYLPRIEALFGLPQDSYEAPDILGSAVHIARIAKWPTFRKRNVYSLLRDRVEAMDGPEIWINATVTGFGVEDGRLANVTAEGLDGARIDIASQEVVIAAGAIESTRLLLLLDRQNPGLLIGTGLGEGFHDHLSAVIGEIDVIKGDAFNRLAGFRFVSGGGMRNLRFELASASPLRGEVPLSFAHVGFAETEGGFSALRDLLRALQRRQLPSPTIVARLAAGLPWLARAVLWRYWHHRLLYPADAQLELHMVVEQKPQAENRITLSESLSDPWGQPMARIDWRVSAEDKAGMAAAIAAFAETWTAGPLRHLAKLKLRPLTEVETEMAGGGGIYHPGGSTRMAARPEEGVVDPELRVFGLPNLSLCATSVLPRGGGTNPTMMLLLLTLRCADRLAPTAPTITGEDTPIPLT